MLGVPRRLALAGVVAVVGAVCVFIFAARSEPPLFVLDVTASRLPADGVSTATITLREAKGHKLPPAAILRIVEGKHRGELEPLSGNARAATAVLRVGVLPGPIVVEARAPNVAPVAARVETVLDAGDRWGDGTPDFLRLDSPEDREAFRGWFTYLAEAQAFRPAVQLPEEINDCAALIRFAYRESLREHDGAWARSLRLSAVPALSPVRKYRYPFTPLGAALFRIDPGAFHESDLPHAFAEFADAQTLARLNTDFVTRDLRGARPGDLLFFRQPDQRMPYHAMIFLGRGHFASDEDWIVYHTGPVGQDKGEIRRISVRGLMQYPLARWRPLPHNPGFLGVYRWNILREAD